MFKKFLFLAIFSATVLTVSAQTTDLTVKIEAPPDGSALIINQPTTFRGSASGGSGFYSWIWNFGDGTQGGGREFVKTYTKTGDFTVTLTVTDTSNKQGTASIRVRVVSGEEEDNMPPSRPEITFSSHREGEVTTRSEVTIHWSQSTDQGGSGLAGYSFLFDQQPLTDPDKVVETAATGTVRTLVPGTWFFHLVAVDNAGNVSRPTTHYGPIIIESGGKGKPIIRDLRITDVTATSVVVRWRTDRLADSRVIFDTESHPSIEGKDPPNFGYAFSTPTQDENGVLEHAVTVSGLKPDTVYYFRAVSRAR